MRLPVRVSYTAGKDDCLFNAVTITAFADVQKESVGHEFDHRQIAFLKHIKEADSCTATISVRDAITVNAKFDVIGKT